jgi:tRNA A-37 threonylcarbamoyl transferase component Bud32
MEETFNIYKAGGLKWIVREGYRDLTDLDFTGKGVLSQVDENNVRIRGFVNFRDEKLFVKVFKKRDRLSPLLILKALLFGHGARREFDASRYLDDRGVDTPGVIAVGVGSLLGLRAVIVFRSLNDAVRLDEVFQGFEDDSKKVEKGIYIKLLAQITAKLHSASFHHRDYHAGNILVLGRGKKANLNVIDLHRSSFPMGMRGGRALKNIAAVCHSLTPYLADGDIPALLREYKEMLGEDLFEIESALKFIKRQILKMEARRLKSRTKRCLKDSTEFSVEKGRGRVVYRRREVEIDRLMGLIEEFKGGGGTVLKEDKKAKIVLFKQDGGEVCVKGYGLSSIKDVIWTALGKSRGHVSWRSARGLAVRGFNTPLPLALVIFRRFYIPSEVYFITESLKPAVELDRFILSAFKTSQNGKEGLLTGLADVIGSLHEKGVYHRDLKGTNIGVKRERGDYTFALIDLDDVSFTAGVNLKRRARNLSQLYLSTPKMIGAGDRKAFFERYMNVTGGMIEGEKIKRGVMKKVKGEELLFVSENGDVIEDWKDLYFEVFDAG